MKIYRRYWKDDVRVYNYDIYNFHNILELKIVDLTFFIFILF